MTTPEVDDPARAEPFPDKRRRLIGSPIVDPLKRLIASRKKSPFERMTLHEFQYDDARVRIYELWTMRPEQAERPDLTTFALVHGLGISSRFFVPLSDALAPYGRVLLFDLPA